MPGCSNTFCSGSIAGPGTCCRTYHSRGSLMRPSLARQTGAMEEVPASAALFERAQRVIPGGVNSPVRAFRAVGGTPRFMVRGSGPYLYDADGREYVDLVCSWGPMILGHAHPAVLEAVRRAAANGFSY